MTMSRRRFLVTGFAAGIAGSAFARLGSADAGEAYVWSGSALGGEARIALYGAGKAEAQQALIAAVLEIERLENIFSLYRETSEISLLNQHGTLDYPSHDLSEVLRASIAWRAKTGGAFDPTVQPLWQAAAHGREITQDLIGLAGTAVSIAANSITLAQRAQVTLNGIAQGRIADRVTEILAQHGFDDVVIDAGELRLPGKERRSVFIPALKGAVDVAGTGVATSEPGALVFDLATFRHHIIDPKTGSSPYYWQSISVFAPSAEMADALSTAFAILPLDTVSGLTHTIGDVAIIGALKDGQVVRLGETGMFRDVHG